MKRKYWLVTLVFIFFENATPYAQSPAFEQDNIKQLIGNWKGSLTYLDYTSKKSYTMPAELNITHLANSNQLVFSNTYPNEPKANNADTITLFSNGKMIDNETVKSKRLTKTGHTQIVTEYAGTDGNDNRPALIRHTYVLGTASYVKTKEVRFEGEAEWIKRHEYNYTRK